MFKLTTKEKLQDFYIEFKGRDWLYRKKGEPPHPLEYYVEKLIAILAEEDD